MLTGRYRDVVRTGGVVVMDAGWRSNTIVDRAWTLMTARLRNEPGLDGLSFLALGTGQEGWDVQRGAARPDTEALVDEVRRVPVPDAAMRYLSREGEPVDGPSSTLEVSLEIEWEEDVQLREFGLFGGDATDQADSGWMVNHVVHPRLDLSAGQRLTRTVRLSFGRQEAQHWLEIGSHWLGTTPVVRIEGVGPAYEAALADLQVQSIGELARLDPSSASEDLPRTRMLELRARARLALQTVLELRPPAALRNASPADLIQEPLDALADRLGADADDLAPLREQVAVLDASLDHDFLHGLALGDLASRHLSS